mmetsp:Transcript_16892/g.23260  ORF Transcript_16892/g.23260 Transcript_16892/m.23260 type:complete len:92 (-) Transcript_16892:613-888(-)|eukprot:CAMPEP_0170130696 /NCGR_PEP_ID=MMETSP0020_2-20130122/22761_1 /TAXON_ID=98059 /ORGANISM="Dinobryon sp., Strain UTEXLB2267" /LENGTH=91 /DNA_ID=CAMNT_0010365539 /DNA_START=1 /DNA_END=276 /DNA_ORIENTATION=+
MPSYIFFSTYYKYAEWSTDVAKSDEEAIKLCREWLLETGYEIPEDQSVDSMIYAVLNGGEDQIKSERGWGYVKVYKVGNILEDYGPDGGSK